MSQEEYTAWTTTKAIGLIDTCLDLRIPELESSERLTEYLVRICCHGIPQDLLRVNRRVIAESIYIMVCRGEMFYDGRCYKRLKNWDYSPDSPDPSLPGGDRAFRMLKPII